MMNAAHTQLKRTPRRAYPAPIALVLAAMLWGNSGLSVAQTPAAHPTAPAAADLLQRGSYLARAGDCVACHTAPQGQPFAGGLAINTPLGRIVSTNITPSKTHGIGQYSLQQFSDALRHGTRADGAKLYPAMPYTAYALVSDEDTAALYAYFMQSVSPVDEPNQPSSLPFPFNIRLSMAVWNALFLDSKPYVADASKSAQWNRGAYLVNGLAHCGTCHTPRNFLMAEKASQALAGADLGTWYAPNISPDRISGIGEWSTVQIAQYLKTGHVRDRAQAAGPMAEAIDNSLRHLSDSDLIAMVAYLKSVPAVRDPADIRPAHSWGAPAASAAYEALRGQSSPNTAAGLQSGPQLYDAYCATCHQARGEGVKDQQGHDLPALFHNTALGHRNSNNLVMAILEGVHREDETGDVLMPAFAAHLSDEQVSSLAQYLLQQFGNPQATVTPEQVRTLREGGQASHLLTLARGGMALVVLAALGGLIPVIKRRRAA
jgi:mono/diheme cytochrome c family protein